MSRRLVSLDYNSEHVVCAESFPSEFVQPRPVLAWQCPLPFALASRHGGLNTRKVCACELNLVEKLWALHRLPHIFGRATDAPTRPIVWGSKRGGWPLRLCEFEG